MEINYFIRVYDNILKLPSLSSFIKLANQIQFEDAMIGGKGTVDKKIRSTKIFSLNSFSDSLSCVHWSNYLFFVFNNYLQQYKKELNILDLSITKLASIDLLKYEENDKYVWHTDHFEENPRTLSIIFLLNNDYEGGELNFRNPDGSGLVKIETKPNRLVIWPSCFLYPHSVTPVTKGTRYSVVSWAV